MRISFVMSSLRLSGGVSLVVEYANRLAARGHRVSLITPASTLDPEIGSRIGPTVQICEVSQRIPALSNPAALVCLCRKLAAMIPVSDVLVATHTPTVVPVLWAARRGQGHPVWLYMDYHEMFRHRPIEWFLLDQAPRWFPAIATISSPLRDRVAARTKAQVVVTGSGLRRPDIFRPPQTRERNVNQHRLLYLGDPRPRKGLHEAVRAAELVAETMTELVLMVVTKQPSVIKSSVPVEIHFRPSDEQLADVYRLADVLLFTSWGEGLGYPPLEAMASGVPVVLTDSVGVRDYARPGENCLIVLPRDVKGLAQAVRRVLEDEPLARRLSNNGLQTVARYDWETAVSRFEALIASVAAVSYSGFPTKRE